FRRTSCTRPARRRAKRREEARSVDEVESISCGGFKRKAERSSIRTTPGAHVIRTFRNRLTQSTPVRRFSFFGSPGNRGRIAGASTARRRCAAKKRRERNRRTQSWRVP